MPKKTSSIRPNRGDAGRTKPPSTTNGSIIPLVSAAEVRRETEARLAAPTPKPKAKRGLLTCWANEESGYRIVRIRDEKDVAHYLVHTLTETTFRVTKLERRRETVYLVSIGPIPLCGCDGYMYRSTCRHVEALSTMRAI